MYVTRAETRHHERRVAKRDDSVDRWAGRHHQNSSPTDPAPSSLLDPYCSSFGGVAILVDLKTDSGGSTMTDSLAPKFSNPSTGETLRPPRGRRPGREARRSSSRAPSIGGMPLPPPPAALACDVPPTLDWRSARLLRAARDLDLQRRRP